MPRLALFLAVASLGCSLSIAAFFVGVPLGLMAVALAIGGRGKDPVAASRRTANRAFAVGSLGLCIGLAVWFVHVRAAQTAYRIPDRREVVSDFQKNLASARKPKDAP